MKEEPKETEIGWILENWRIETLENVTLLKEGLKRGPFGGALKKDIFVNSGYKVYEQKNAIYKNMELGSYYIDENKYQELKGFEVLSGDLIVSCSGTIGRIAQIPAFAEKGVINQALLRIRLNPKKIHTSFFFHLFESEVLQNKIIDSTQGGAMKNLVGMSEFRKTKFCCPPLPEQQKIAEIFSTVDEKIDLIGEQISQTGDLKRGLMQRLLTKGIGHSRFKDSPLGEIPESWEVVNVEDVASICTGGKDTQNKVNDGEYPFYVRSNTIERINSFSFDGEAVLTSGDGVGVGKIYHYVNGKFDYHQRVYNIHNFNSGLLGHFFYFYFSQHFYKRVKKFSAKNSVDSVRMDMISKMEIPLPPLSEQLKIAATLSTVDEKLKVLQNKKQQYQELKKGLMQQLLTGKIRVTNLLTNAIPA